MGVIISGTYQNRKLVENLSVISMQRISNDLLRLCHIDAMIVFLFQKSKEGR